MTTWQAMHELEKRGYRFALEGEDVRAELLGTPPPEAARLLAIAGQNRESARDYVRTRQAGHIPLDTPYTVAEALAIAQAVKCGEARLLGKVVYHAAAGTVSVPWEAVNGDAEALLERRREWLINALKRRLQAMDEGEYWKLSAEEYARYCAKYGQYRRVLEMAESGRGAAV